MIIQHIVYNETVSVGSIVKLEGIKTVNTVLSEEFQNDGGEIHFHGYKLYDPWKRIITGIKVPPLKVTYEMDGDSIAVLHPLAVRANTVARMLYEYRNGTKEFKNIQNAINSYYVELSNTIFGKSGVFNRYIMGPRLKKSFRAVAIPGCYKLDIYGESYEHVGIPRKICKHLKINDGDIVLIGRDPTIWMGSVEFLYAYPVDHEALEIHPLILPQFGGDHDGDQFWGYYPKQELIPENIICSFTRRYSKWNKNFNLDKETNIVDWKNYSTDESSRIKTTGFSISPLDIVEKNKDLERITNYCNIGSRARGLADYEELLKYAKGLDIKEWQSITEAINRAQLSMKIFMGPVGLLALRLIVLGNLFESIKHSAHILAERCAQGLLDAKHLSFEQIKNFKPARIFEILNLRDKNIKSSQDMLKALREIVPCSEEVLPALDFIFVDGRGIAKMSKEDCELFEGTTSTANMNPSGYMPQIVFDTIDPNQDIFNFAFYEGAKECYSNDSK